MSAPSSWSAGRRPITIAILAMGGEGGGVLADWIVAVGEQAGYYSQNTSVAGVAQRTGATVYYVELYPRPDDQPAGVRTEPVLSLFPTPGEVDVVIASELMEAGRSVQRGFSTPDRTTLIASTNRVYSMDERLAVGDGRVDSNGLLEAAHAGSRRLIAADFMKLAEDARSVISAALFGALAGSGELPFERAAFEDAIRASGKGVDASLAAFAAGYDAAGRPAPVPLPEPAPAAPGSGPVPITIGRRRPVDPAEEAAAEEERRRDEIARSHPGHLVGPHLQPQAARVAGAFPVAARSMLLHGCVRTAVYQDPAYSDRYLARVARLAAVDPDAEGAAALTTEAARHVALWMTYQDTIHVAQQKIRRRRIEGVRTEAKAAPGQLVNVREYLHPQVEEITDTLPTRLGRWLAGSSLFAKVVGKVTRNGIVVNTTGIIGFTLLWIMARFRPLRPRSLRFGREQVAIDAWLDRAVAAAATDAELAREIVECQRVLKGYGATHHHGQESFGLLMDAVDGLSGRTDAAAELVRLRTAALADEDGTALRAALGPRVVVPARAG
ncbi:indolepyruvate oxidoreductase subunit beta family protein [Pimelobacter simplex]|uniref:Indolepyruvate oxidoreductase subunit IorB II n=1 Tax=Nocardioides simplex TaxID=2045 RepID=A0A0C5XB63_NOCSI|nr:indolepyruvate oxidoreductase subunit beta family protein [Pimelobacter simplex]AJR18495.1 Indolepyruvate oxidoreductase subunit IorB II [Pimelobacter simplex]MCG8152726.1 indolepyruvate oxidoreductase subunit beta family protein [Pimelobacter simplex]SFM74331.1 indolepyruvate ferredoxin oxidoreductase beta subunit [Pimelobacter simplex]